MVMISSYDNQRVRRLASSDRTSNRIIMVHAEYQQLYIQWNPSCEATPFAPEKWSFKRGGLLPGVEINTFMFRFTLSSDLSRRGGLSSGWPLKWGSTVLKHIYMFIHTCYFHFFQILASACWHTNNCKWAELETSSSSHICMWDGYYPDQSR